MYRIGKTFSFSAAHSLPSLPPDHKCHRMHGHNYTVTLELTFPGLDQHGMVMDYADMAEDWRPLYERLDHQCLNEVLDIEPTAENLARFIYEQLADGWEPFPELLVRVQETPTTFAEYQP